MMENTQVYDKDKHIEVLQTTNNALANEIKRLREEKKKKHDEESLKWRGKAFYYKNELAKCRAKMNGSIVDDNL